MSGEVGYLSRAISDMQADIDTGLSGVNRASGELHSVVANLHWLAHEIADTYENTSLVDRISVEVRQHLDAALNEVYEAADRLRQLVP
jgi:hypothetical protein